MKRLMLGLAIALAMPHAAHADSADVPALIKLVDTEPADMDRSTWKEKRREAVKKLAESKDKRAVPVLIKLADNETFDIIGEIAIEGLGTLGDPSAIPTLQKIVGDPARDKGQRDLARKSLQRLGGSSQPAPTPAPAPPTPAPAPPTPTPTPDTGLENNAAPPDTTGSKLIDSGAPAPQAPTDLPQVDDDTLAAYDRVTFAAGTASLSYDTVSKELQAEGNVNGLWQKRVEHEQYAWGVDAGGSFVGGLINPQGRAQTRGIELDANADGEGRFYSHGFYGIGRVAADVDIDYVADLDAMNAANDFKQTLTDADLQVAIGAGYGRELDIGGAIRVRRLSRALDANRALGKPIDAATSKKLQLTWWSLRAERSTYRALLATIAILREAGVLLGEPDAGVTYEILNVLRDTYLYQRLAGFDANIEFGEGYLRRPAGVVADNFENGRVEQVLVNAGYGVQLDDDKMQLVATGYARDRLFAPMGAPSPWAVGASATATRFTYGEHGDQFGAIDLTATVQYSGDDVPMNVDNGFSLAAQLGFTYLINQASGLRLAAQVAEDDGELLFGATLTATYGLLDGTFAR
jgi:HEAT repeats